MKWRWYVYILECDDASYYVGMTWQPDPRWTQHLSGLGSNYTSLHKPKRLVYIEEYDSIEDARSREKQIKGWSRVKKEKLMGRQWSKHW